MIKVGDPLVITSARPRWWDVLGWIRWLRRPRLSGSYHVTGITASTIQMMVARSCHVCGGDCASANPPVTDCPMQWSAERWAAYDIAEHERPPEPDIDTDVWYRGWEVGFDYQAGFWTGDFWRAYKGGCDLDAPHVSAHNYASCLDAIDDDEDE